MASCAIAFGAGTHAAPAPQKFEDMEVRDDSHGVGTGPPTMPTVGLSLVSGGKAYDAGTLPRTPVPIVKPL